MWRGRWSESGGRSRRTFQQPGDRAGHCARFLFIPDAGDHFIFDGVSGRPEDARTRANPTAIEPERAELRGGAGFIYGVYLPESPAA